MINADSATPTTQSPTGTAYAVNCSEGYTLSGNETGFLLCDSSGNWNKTKPTCDGIKSISIYI